MRFNRLIVLLFFCHKAVFGLEVCQQNDPLACSLNGDCVDSKCKCDAGWTGPFCAQLDLAPANPEPALYRDETATWGMSVIRDEQGLYHGFVSAFHGHCGLNSWQHTSEIWHVKSTSPFGPFVNETVVVAKYDNTSYFRHNPTIVYHPQSKTYLLSHVGCGNYTMPTAYQNCSHGITPTQSLIKDANDEDISAIGPCMNRTFINLISKSLDGPWLDVGLQDIPSNQPFPRRFSNPAPFVLKNGSILVMIRHYNGTKGSPYHSVIAISRSNTNDWSQGFTVPKYPILGNGSQPPFPQLEDPFLWHDSRGYKAIFHTLGGCENVGCYAYSIDSYTWHMTDKDEDGIGYAYSYDIPLTNGTTLHASRRERPHLIFDAETNEKPIALVNSYQPNRHNDHTLTISVPFHS